MQTSAISMGTLGFFGGTGVQIFRTVFYVWLSDEVVIGANYSVSGITPVRLEGFSQVIDNITVFVPDAAFAQIV